jgi:class 3 adenylate cyclase
MSENIKESNQEESSSDEQSQNKSDVVDMLLSKKDLRVVDTDTLIQETQKRVWGALKKGYEYAGMVDESDAFLRSHVFSKINMMVLYVDLIGSTTMTLELPGEKLATIISSFSQEMASLIKQFKGYVLKFAGDAVIGYFVAEPNTLQAADNVVSCAKSMITIVEKGINPILNQYDYPDLMVKVGIDFGKNIVVRYGADEKQSHVDLMGPAMNIASKIQSMAKPNQILIGDDVYTKLHPTLQRSFKQIVWKNNEWRYRSRITGDIYKVYEYMG